MFSFLTRYRILLVAFALIVVAGTAFVGIVSSQQVDFSADVKPIINSKCITCHGGVKAKGGFSLLFREEALARTESGVYGIVPGDAKSSEMIRRLTLKDPEERMPYQHAPLSKEEIAILTKWVEQGAKWGEHWAYQPLQKTPAPSLKDEWIINDIDKFILEKLEENDLKPSAEADKAALLRRVSLDLTGMPASESVATRFLGSKAPDAYAVLVDSLLASPHFGERWAALWLDLARYADTKGYERDDNRNIWMYRDWLIDAFNNDKPYNKFIVEQIAGDLMPSPTDAEYIATAFHRNTMTNDEGGTDNEEFRTAAVMDRVNTTWEAMMGTSFSCVQCHSHPYDPFRHEEYYQFMAYFNNTRDEDTHADYPLLRTLNDSLHEKLNTLKAWLKKNADDEKANEISTFVRTWQPAINSLTADEFKDAELNDTKWLSLRNKGIARLKKVDLDKIDHLIYRYASGKTGGSFQLRLDSAKGKQIAIIRADTTRGWRIAETSLPQQQGVHDLYIVYNNPTLKNPEESGLQFDWLSFRQQFPGRDQPDYQQYKKLFWDLLNAPSATIPVMMDNPGTMNRESYVFDRGNWLIKGKKVNPGVPASLAMAMPKDAPPNRLGMARWLTDPRHPLVARTMTNRLWEQLFGTGIVETLEDMGTQGIPPTHRELLDHLSYQFIHQHKWSVKSLLREMVMSATYRQDSKSSPELQEKDPFNKFYARASRIRLSAEQVRDQALSISGALNPALKGPSVYPYQPKGIWLSPWNGREWKMSQEGQQYRRALYTFFKRTSPYPAMITFDGASREVCATRRIRTNTPLQALVTLNDSSYTDMSSRFAERMTTAAPGDPAKQIAAGFRMMLYKEISEEKKNILIGLYQTSLKKFRQKPLAGQKPEHSALVLVANAMLNLDEVITKS